MYENLIGPGGLPYNELDDLKTLIALQTQQYQKLVSQK